MSIFSIILLIILALIIYRTLKKNNISDIDSAIDHLAEETKETMNDIQQHGNRAAETIKEQSKDIIEDMKENAEDLGESIEDHSKNLKESVRKTANKVRNKIEQHHSNKKHDDEDLPTIKA